MKIRVFDLQNVTKTYSICQKLEQNFHPTKLSVKHMHILLTNNQEIQWESPGSIAVHWKQNENRHTLQLT